ncbi:hypothetical protein Dimus_036939 [Dionaea muscipula]
MSCQPSHLKDRRFDEMQAQIDPMRRSLEEAQGGLTHKKAKKTQALLSAWAQLTTRWVSAGPVRLLLQKPKGSSESPSFPFVCFNPSVKLRESRQQTEIARPRRSRRPKISNVYFSSSCTFA